MMLKEVVVYITKNKTESIYVQPYLSKDEITEIVNKTFRYWLYYDIL